MGREEKTVTMQAGLGEIGRSPGPPEAGRGRTLLWSRQGSVTPPTPRSQNSGFQNAGEDISVLCT